MAGSRITPQTSSLSCRTRSESATKTITRKWPGGYSSRQPGNTCSVQQASPETGIDGRLSAFLINRQLEEPGKIDWTGWVGSETDVPRSSDPEASSPEYGQNRARVVLYNGKNGKCRQSNGRKRRIDRGCELVPDHRHSGPAVRVHPTTDVPPECQGVIPGLIKARRRPAVCI